MSLSTFEDKILVLLRFWDESLEATKILRKLTYKVNNTSHKLSEKELKLKMFLERENQDLLKLPFDSTTRKYGELAIISRKELVNLL